MQILKSKLGWILVLFLTFSSPVFANGLSEEITLSNGKTVTLSFSGSGDSYEYRVEFENGHYYYWKQNGSMGAGGGSTDLTREEMDLAEEAIDIYEQKNGPRTSSSDPSLMGFGFLFLIIGALGAFYPYGAWYLEIGWKLQDAEPSDLALGFNRFIGVVFVIIGLFMMIGG